MKITVSRLSLLWLLLFVSIALAIAAAVHSEFRVSWDDLGPAVLVAVAIQWSTWEAMAWARRRFRPRNDPRASILIAGVYCAALISVGMYYVEKWRLVGPAGREMIAYIFPHAFSLARSSVLAYFRFDEPVDSLEKSGNDLVGVSKGGSCVVAANNGTQQPKSPARQQCEQKAQQQFQQAKSAAATNAWNGFKIGFFTTTAVNAAAGCAIGGGVGAALGTTIAEFTGATSSFGGAAVGCFTGGVDSALNGLVPSMFVGGITGGASYLVDYSSAKSAYNQAMQACSQIP